MTVFCSLCRGSQICSYATGSSSSYRPITSLSFANCHISYIGLTVHVRPIQSRLSAVQSGCTIVCFAHCSVGINLTVTLCHRLMCSALQPLQAQWPTAMGETCDAVTGTRGRPPTYNGKISLTHQPRAILHLDPDQLTSNENAQKRLANIYASSLYNNTNLNNQRFCCSIQRQFVNKFTHYSLLGSQPITILLTGIGILPSIRANLRHARLQPKTACQVVVMVTRQPISRRAHGLGLYSLGYSCRRCIQKTSSYTDSKINMVHYETFSSDNFVQSTVKF